VQTTLSIKVIGGGLAGTEAAWQAAQLGIFVYLYEMRPKLTTGAHQTSDLAELVCSNSLGSILSDRASGVLNNELHKYGSLLLDCAQATALPAGSALAVDRASFARTVTERIMAHPNIKLIRQEITEIPSGPVIIASGPLTSNLLSQSLSILTGEDLLSFYDAIAPIIVADTINMNIAFRASRFGVGDSEEGDYINCPFSKQEYEGFVNALANAERISLHNFEKEIDQGVDAGMKRFFEGCLPVEVIAKRGIQSLAFGPMRPTGLKDPRTRQGAYAILQLRQDNLAGDQYNLVGFQTNLTSSEQKRVFRMIPGLEQVEFVRYGQMHRNTFIASPRLLLPTLQYHKRPDLFFAGQITGVEGYMGNIATGLLAGWNIARLIKGHPPLPLPPETMLGALCHYITHADLKYFQPMKANFGILPPLLTNHRISKRERSRLYAERADMALNNFIDAVKRNE
jgi:methylenetetrahydrofolate--tRNA-(uracil-5-)-methyltransferase